MNGKTKEKGITLIALVVTIIVLIILAAVSLSMLTGENEILTQAKLSKSKTEEVEIREEVELAIQEILLEKGYKEQITTSKMGEYLAEKLDGITIVETTDSKIKIEYKGYEIEIESNWKVKVIGKAGIIVTYTIEPTGYTKDSVEIILNTQTKEGINISSITPQNETVEIVQENVKFKVTENAVYQFKLVDNSNNERTIQVLIDNIDKDAPNAQIELITKTSFVNGKIKAKVTINDEKSGVDLEKCKWVLKKDTTPVGTDIASYTGGSISNEEGEIETGKIAEIGFYYIHLLVIDKLGNAKEYCSDEIKIENGYAISTPQEFQNMKNDLSGDYYVVNDIDMSGFDFKCIRGSFTGTLDGRGYTISNLSISGDETDCFGIFSEITGDATISNLLIKNVNINTLRACVGVIAGLAKGDNITIEKVGITGTIKAWQDVAIFIGFTNKNPKSVTFRNCYARCDISSTGGKWDSCALINGDPSPCGPLIAECCYWSGTNNFSSRTSSFISSAGASNNGNQAAHSNISVKNCYYDKEKFPLSIASKTSGIGLTTENMKKQESYVGWDFENIWEMGKDGYPELKFDKNN